MSSPYRNAYGGEIYTVDRDLTAPPPRGIRLLSASLVVGAVAGAALAVLAEISYLRVARSPLYLNGSLLTGDYGDAYQEIVDVLHRLAFEVGVGVAAALLLGLCAVRVLRPRTSARTQVLSISLVMFAAMVVVASLDGGVGGSVVAQAQLPGWYPAVQGVELLVMLALAPVILFVWRRRFRDYYEYGA